MPRHAHIPHSKEFLTIGEMAAWLDVSSEVLRKWERDFPGVIRPMRTPGGTRLYDRRQQEQVAMLYRLLREEGMTIAGARQRLRSAQPQEERIQVVLERLRGVRRRLMDVVEELDKVFELQ